MKSSRHTDVLAQLPYAKLLETLNLYYGQGHLLCADLSNYWKIFHNEYTGVIFNVVPSSGPRGHTFKINPHTAHWKSADYFQFHLVNMWNSLPNDNCPQLIQNLGSVTSNGPLPTNVGLN